MGTFSIWHWLVVLLVILLLFGSGKISGLMGDLAKGIKSFKQNIKEDEKDASMEAQAAPQAPAGTIPGPQQGQAAATEAQPQAGNRPAA
ncbi:twin-arginine translocase TatA/TatE family subunit [Roseomonas alkaliterrae]|jgi:sec-independent protein translocase protein TatA|uniref:Sec-independent protein translocase protein TatA n=1 Tax=Neoroseomonas alkaliterrae TaxID=1452450 RepID=A0A840XNC3_9PROT|nr:twin-arginine translocase TatA/TatE family subunit [Neoroseomonas alkaliterrae]MBB5688240.1 sec-independent protein translocase protein TatA [Neoroseomonas alkaliterrae]MBR0676060.1 twin-arginine translocase TatA/TatE family subunit [Neoroseomonas alkaliterrae]